MKIKVPVHLEHAVATLTKEYTEHLTAVMGRRVILEVQVLEGSFTKEMLDILICNHFDVTMDDIRSISREREVINPRFCYSWIAKKYLLMSNAEVGEILNRDRTTIISQISAMENLVFTKDNIVTQHLNPLLKKVEAFYVSQ
jgi:chromosomal replication initiation ATPase DnaA